MISVILYGRNDSHGYNLHKRAAISLNCIAEMLSDSDDEVIFVDYNTPNDLPTFIEAIHDTLTGRAKRLLRVLRVRPEIHDCHYGKRTHLVALEPICRNIAIRRSNPNNRWILSTNTDMIFVPRDGVSNLTTVVRDLPEGYYGLPRFELPESLWESFPRLDPVAVLSACEELGKALHLNEVTRSHPWNPFDSPGDFQLIPRRTLFEVFGFDERMIHGWHVDSNICKRLFRLYGAAESLEARLKGYHCDHTRVATLMHRLDLRIDNDQRQFIYDLDDPYARHQALSWGLPDETIEEIDLVDGPGARFISAVQKALGKPQEFDYRSDCNEGKNYVWYHPEHVLPYLVGNLTVYPRLTRLLYIGNHPRLLELLAICVSLQGFTQPVRYLREIMSRPPGRDLVVPVGRGEATEELLVETLITEYDVLIFDFGLDGTGQHLPEIRRVTDWPRALRYRLGTIARYLEACVEQCNEQARSTARRLPDFLVVNANHGNYLFDRLASQLLLTAPTPYNTRVRKGRARVGQDQLYRSDQWRYTENALRSLFGYDVRDETPPPIGLGQSIDFTTSGCSSPWKDGHWGLMDSAGTWTDGQRAELLLSLDPAISSDVLAEVCFREAFVRPGGEPIRVNVLLEEERLDRWVFHSRYGEGGDYTYDLLLRHRLFTGKEACRLTFEVENPQSTARLATASGQPVIGDDPRELGVKLQSITFKRIVDSSAYYCLGSVVDFTAAGNGALHMKRACWTAQDEYGVWTLGPEATLFLYLEPPETPVTAAFTISDAAVNDEFPSLGVDVFFNGEKVDTWALPSRMPQRRKIVVTPERVSRHRPLNISFRIATPRSGVQLKWSADDTRPVGFRLTRFEMRPHQIPSYSLGQIIDFTEGGNAEEFLATGWGVPDPFGRWTEGQAATLVLRLTEPLDGVIPASFLISDCAVGPAAPVLPVEVSVNGQFIERWNIGPRRRPHVRTLEVAPHLVETATDLVINFHIPHPRSPASLGWSGDTRPLGVRLTRASVGRRRLRSALLWRAVLIARAGRVLRRIVPLALRARAGRVLRRIVPA